MAAPKLQNPVLYLFPVLGAFLLMGCGADWPDPAPLADLDADHETWRQSRRDGLVRVPAGTVLWTGLWELAEGANTLGSDSTLTIVLPQHHAPPFAGTLTRTGLDVWFEPAADAEWHLREGEAVTEPMTVRSDRADSTTTLMLGSMGARVHEERGSDRRWLRTWDEASPLVEDFELPEFYPVDPVWRVTARYDPFPEPRVVPLADVTGGTVEDAAPGELVFRIGGKERRLLAFANEGSRDFFVMLWDSTAVRDTYQGGRYIHVPFPELEGWSQDQQAWTTIDFNRTYSPPCVFSDFSVCGFPPRENRLPLWLSAGEKRPDKLP
ncbi:MAG: DUF1684 domain-containing protein [Longimicrobiales bacterium]